MVLTLRAEGGDHLGAVDEGNALLGTQDDGLEPVGRQDRLCKAIPLPYQTPQRETGSETSSVPSRFRAPHLSLPHEAQGEVGEGREVPAAAHRSLFRDPRDAKGCNQPLRLA